MPTHSLFHTPFPSILSLFYLHLLTFLLLFSSLHISSFLHPSFSLHFIHATQASSQAYEEASGAPPPHRKHLSSASEPPLSPASGHSSGRATLPGALHRSRSPSIHRTTWSHATALRPIFQSHCSSVSLSSLHTLESQE